MMLIDLPNNSRLVITQEMSGDISVRLVWSPFDREDVALIGNIFAGVVFALALHWNFGPLPMNAWIVGVLGAVAAFLVVFGLIWFARIRRKVKLSIWTFDATTLTLKIANHCISLQQMINIHVAIGWCLVPADADAPQAVKAVCSLRFVQENQEAVIVFRGNWERTRGIARSFEVLPNSRMHVASRGLPDFATAVLCGLRGIPKRD